MTRVNGGGWCWDFRTRRVFITFLAKFNLYGFTGDICVAYDIILDIFHSKWKIINLKTRERIQE